MTSWEGYPIKHYVFEGNTKDEKTVIDVIKQINKEYKIEETTFVGDRGMITKLNVATIESKGFDYIMGVKHRQSEIHAMLFNDDMLNTKQYKKHNGLLIQEKKIFIKDFLLWKTKFILCLNGVAPSDKEIEPLKELIDSLKNSDEIGYKTIKSALAELLIDSKVCRRITLLIKKYHGQYENKLRTIICLNEERKLISKKKRDLKISQISQLLSELFSKSKEKNGPNVVEGKFSKIFGGYKKR